MLKHAEKPPRANALRDAAKINTLSNDILREIFHNVPDLRSRLSHRLQLAHVQRRWRHVVNSDPLLWSMLELRGERRPYPKSFFDRSGNAPLDLVLYYQNNNVPFLPYMQPQLISRRLKSPYINLATGNAPDEVTCLLGSGYAFPLLEELDCFLPPSQVGVHMETPCLAKLAFEHVRFLHMEKLVNPSLDLIIVWSCDGVPLNFLLHLMAQCAKPGFVEMRDVDLVPPTDPPPTPRFPLAELRFSDVDPDTIIDLLEPLDLSRVLELEIYPTAPPGNDEMVQRAIEGLGIVSSVELGAIYDFTLRNSSGMRRTILGFATVAGEMDGAEEALLRNVPQVYPSVHATAETFAIDVKSPPQEQWPFAAELLNSAQGGRPCAVHSLTFCLRSDGYWFDWTDEELVRIIASGERRLLCPHVRKIGFDSYRLPRPGGGFDKPKDFVVTRELILQLLSCVQWDGGLVELTFDHVFVQSISDHEAEAQQLRARFCQPGI